MPYDRLWIDGKWEASVGGKSLSIENPVNGQIIAEVPDASRADVDKAVKALSASAARHSSA